MNTSTTLLIAGIVVAVLAVFLRDGSFKPVERDKPNVPALPFLILAGIVGLFVFAGLTTMNSKPEVMPIALGFGVGALASGFGYALGLTKWQAGAGKAAPLGLAAATLAILPSLPKAPSAMSAVVGAGIAAWLLSFGQDEEKNPWAIRTTIAMGAGGVLNAIAGPALVPLNWAQAGSWLLIAFSVVVLLCSPLPAGWIRPTFGALILALSGWLIGEKLFLMDNMWMLTGGAAIVGLVVHSMLSGPEITSVRLILASLIWVAVATGAFGIEQGFGMAVALLVGFSVLVLADNRPGLLTLGPLAALVMFRVFFQEHSQTVKHFEVGQHYSIVGLLIGLALPALATEWLRSSAGRTKFFGNFASAAWVLAFAVVPAGVAVLFDSTGLVGFLIGLGIASVVEAARASRSGQTVSLAVTLSAFVALSYQWIEPLMGQEKDDKTKALAWILGAVFVIGIAIAVLGGDLIRPKKEAV